MRVRHTMWAVALATTLAGAAAAQGPPPLPPKPNPGIALASVLINAVYIPPRLAVTAVTGFVAGLTGFMTFGDEQAADAVFGLVNGPMVITPQMLEGTERWHMGEYD